MIKHLVLGKEEISLKVNINTDKMAFDTLT